MMATPESLKIARAEAAAMTDEERRAKLADGGEVVEVGPGGCCALGHPAHC
jgi:hypothetical protein